MIEWLKQSPREVPMIEIGEHRLPIVLRRLPQARRLTLRLAPDGSEVRVSMPRWGRTGEALTFARSRTAWLARQLDALPLASAPRPGGTIAFRGDALRIEHGTNAPRTVRLQDDAILIGGPVDTLVPRLRRWLEGEARRILADDLAHYCTRAGVPLAKLALSNPRRRWGSCGSNGTIRLNWRLVMAPDEIRRSVVAHEVAHLVHFDHSPRFHALLGEIFDGDIGKANRWLKSEGRGLYAVFG